MPSIPDPIPDPEQDRRDQALLVSRLTIARLMSYGPLSTETGE